MPSLKDSHSAIFQYQSRQPITTHQAPHGPPQNGPIFASLSLQLYYNQKVRHLTIRQKMFIL